MDMVIERIKEAFKGKDLYNELSIKHRNGSTVDLVLKGVDTPTITFTAIPKSSLELLGISMVGDTPFLRKNNINNTVNLQLPVIS